MSGENMAIIDTSPEQISKLLSAGIAADLVKLIETELHAHTDPIISKLARDLADKTVVKMQSYRLPGGLNPTVQMVLAFNNEAVYYVPEQGK